MSQPFLHRPIPIRLLNAVGAAALNLAPRRREFEAEALLELARARTGLDDFGPDDFLEPLERLVESYNTEARLNFIGWLSVRTHLLQLLENRLRIARTEKLLAHVHRIAPDFQRIHAIGARLRPT